MPLVDLDLEVGHDPIPGDVQTFLREAEQRIDRLLETSRIAAFVPSDFERAYRFLQALGESGMAPGSLFCEWGSGFGVVACLASMLDFDACGIEIEGELVEAAQQLADDFGLPVEFIHGSFIPPGGEAYIDVRDEFAWLTTQEDWEETGLAPDDMDVIFSYPWPDEEGLINRLFEGSAAVGAVLVTYHSGADFRLQRKTRARSRRL